MNQVSDDNQNEDEEILHVPVDGVLDLHTFKPAEVKAVVLAYIEACQEEDIRELRIVHGKGMGILQRQVHALLSRHPDVEAYSLAPGNAGGWGATLVTLSPGTRV